jgi:hypothetical protein
MQEALKFFKNIDQEKKVEAGEGKKTLQTLS